MTDRPDRPHPDERRLRGARHLHPSSHRRGPAPAPPVGDRADVLVISCDDCAMRRTATCADCVVTFVLRADADPGVVDLVAATGAPGGAASEPGAAAGELELDADEVRAVRLLAKAGLVPLLRYELAG